MMKQPSVCSLSETRSRQNLDEGIDTLDGVVPHKLSFNDFYMIIVNLLFHRLSHSNSSLYILSGLNPSKGQAEICFILLAVHERLSSAPTAAFHTTS